MFFKVLWLLGQFIKYVININDQESKLKRALYFDDLVIELYTCLSRFLKPNWRELQFDELVIELYTGLEPFFESPI
jgi:hypothetical protein